MESDMSKTFHFKIEHPDKVDLIVSGLASEKENGKNGYFSWMGLQGTYKLDDQYLDLDITDKPLVVSWSVIESNLQKFFRCIHIL